MTDCELAFGAICLRPWRREVLRNGVALKLSSRGLDVLHALLERPGELLSRRDLIARVWHGRVVEDANLTVQVSQLRQQLGADGESILTEPGRGYRFVGALTSASPAPVTPAPEPARASAASGRLAERLGVLIGREAALDAIDLEIDAARAITLVGPGGIGKTRLASEAARRSRPRFADGVFVVDLVPLGSADAIAATLSEMFGIKAQQASALDGVLDHLRERSLLMLFDNCEHVIEPAAAIVARILATCPRVAVLATSREALRVDGERVVAVRPLALASDEAIERGDAVHFPATQLFIDRVRSMQSEFDPTAAEAATMARVCQRLDGLPLAIELAAGRVPALGVDQVAARLADGLKILSNGSRSAARRHLTLQATLAWSHDLLAPKEQLTFRRLAVFAHTFTLATAEDVLAAPDLSDWDIVGAIDSLVAKSMLVAEDDAGTIRYRMLGTMNSYALERLAAAGERDALAHRLASSICAVCRDAERDYRSLDGVTWLKRYASELPNLRAALGWAFGDTGDTGDSRLGVEIAVYSWPIWRETALVEGQSWLARAEARLDASTDAAIRALLWSARGWLSPHARVSEAVENFRRAASEFRRLHDDLRLGEALRGLGQALTLTGKPAEGYPVLVEARSLIEKAGAPASLAACLESLAQSLHLSGRYAESRSFYSAAIELFRSIGAGRRAASVLNNLGDLSYAAGDLDGAIGCAAAAAEQLRRSGVGGSHLAAALGNLTGFHIARGEIEAACRTAVEAWPLLISAGLAYWFFDHLAALGALVGDCDNAARFLSYSDAAYTRQRDYRQPSEQKAYEAASRIVHEQIHDARLQELLLAGRAWTTEQAITRATDFLQQFQPGVGVAARCAGSLREPMPAESKLDG